MIPLNYKEYNFDGLAGPTHNYAGLASGNMASTKNRFAVSHPQQAALEGLAKIKLLHHLGIKEGIIPPHERPSIKFLRARGYSGKDEDILEKAAKTNPKLLQTAGSASSMWTANAAAVSPSADTGGRRIHLTPANLVTHPHRAIEPPETAVFLKKIFFQKEIFTHHRPLDNNGIFFDEGAANHLRLCGSHGEKGLEIFVYGKEMKDRPAVMPRKFPARQSLEASEAIARHHKLDFNCVLFLRQNPKAIDQGVFHNDVIAAGNENVLLYHEEAFLDHDTVIESIQKIFNRISGKELYLLKVRSSELSLKEAVQSYFFNSQLVTLPRGGMALICPEECRDGGKVEKLIKRVIAAENPVQEVYFVKLAQSMRNGGGPACLRLRVVLNEREAQGVFKGCLVTEGLLQELEAWIKRHYRAKLHWRDLQSKDILRESRRALDELTGILKLGSIYSFQR